MRFIRFQFVLILILAAGLCLPLPSSAQTPEQSTKKVAHHKGKPAAGKAPPKKSEEQASMPAAPPPPTPEQLPSQPPTVTYENGQLAIVAPNSTLSDILHAVHNQTGANIDIPPGANERVVSSFGPGPARDVLTSLLNGSHFNYVMVGSVADPNAVAQVILTPRAGGETPPTVQAGQAAGLPIRPRVAPQPYPQPQVQNQMPVEEPGSSDGMEEEDASQDTNVDNGVDQGAPEPGQGTEGQNPNQPVVKTPEQLLQELQRQQQMVQQQQQQQRSGQQQQQPQAVTPTPPPDSRPQPR